MADIICDKLTVEKSGIKILDSITCAIPHGEVVAIAGPNGAGKSTFVRALIGLEDISSGSADLNVPTEKTRYRRVDYVPQYTRQFNHLIPATVSDLFTFSRQAYPEIISELNINELFDKKMKNLSGGQVQRVFLAHAMLSSPQILVLDEPTAALDPLIRHKFSKIISDFHKKTAATILYVTHDIGSIGEIADKLIYLEEKIIFFGTFGDFCHSGEMSKYFGADQHIMCHQHKDNLYK